MADPTTPGAPVPPYTVPLKYGEHTYWAYRDGYETGYAQALPERKELAEIIDGLLQFTHENPIHGDVIPIDEPGEEIFCDFLDRARAAAERLRGGGS